MPETIRLPNHALSEAFNRFEVSSRLSENEKELLRFLKLLVVSLMGFGRVTPFNKDNHVLSVLFANSTSSAHEVRLRLDFGYQDLMVYDCTKNEACLIGSLNLNKFESMPIITISHKLFMGVVP